MSVQLIVLIVCAVLFVGAYFYSKYRQNKQRVKTTISPKTTSKNEKKLNWTTIILIMIVLVGGYYIYKNYQKDEIISIPLSEAITLSKSNTFNDLVIQNSGGASNLKFVVADGFNDVKTIDINDKEISLNAKDDINVDAGYVSVKDLVDMGLVLPAKYRSETISSGINWIGFLSNFLLIGVLIAIYYFMIIGRGSQKFTKDKNSITFNDIGGVGEAKERLNEVVNFLKDKSYFENLGARIPRGILLEGPPGVGKTMLAKAVATEADVPFYYTSGSEFHSAFVGIAGMKVKKLFKQARKTPSVIFIDEFDSIANARGSGHTDAGREWNHTLNQLLSEMDGFENNSQVIVLAATNRADVLDPAVLRPGRFDRKIFIPLPSLKDRVEILKIHAKGKPFESGIDIENLAKQTSGFSGAELALLLNEAAIIAGQDHKDIILSTHVIKAIDKVLAGEERKSLVLTPDEKRLIATHEAGHALIANLIPDADKVQRISILPRGQVGGFTRTAADKEELLVSKAKAQATIAVFLGGRAAEEIIIGNELVSSGAKSDLERANQIARGMVENYGMGENFGLRYALTNSMGLKDLSIDSQKTIDSDVQNILDKCYTKAKDIIDGNMISIKKLIDALLEKESLDFLEVKNILGGVIENGR
ncbi:MAG: AAA family ATPase [Lutibacter sp.]|jgi:cell division protease FtsH